MKHKISRRDYSYQCAEGCCDEAGLEWYVNEEFVHRSPCEESGWLAVFAHLGIQVELVHQNNEGEDIWCLEL